MKKILILGASFLQVPIIKEANRLGYKSIVIDQNPQAEGFRYADDYKLISTLDYKKIRELVADARPDGIVTAATDMPMRVISKIGQEFNLNTIPYNVACNTTDKVLMREKLYMDNVPMPKFKVVKNFEEFNQAINTMKGKCIIKPADSSGSRGVYLLENRLNLLEKYERTKRYSKSGVILVEEFLQGKEVSVEAFTENGQTTIIAITDKITTAPPYFTEMGHVIQSDLNEAESTAVKDLTIQTIQSMGIKLGPTHTEIMVTDKGPKVIEIGARLGGDMISSHLVPHATGINLLELHLRQSVRDKLPNYNNVKNNGSAIRYFNSHKGVLKKIEIPELLFNNENVIDIQINKEIGSKIENINDSTSRIGFIVCKGTDSKAAINECEKALKEIKIFIE